MDDGATSLTTMDTTVELLPPPLVAVRGELATEVMAVGVPEIAPVEVSAKDRRGRAETDHDVTVPPLTDGVAVVMATFVKITDCRCKQRRSVGHRSR